MSTAASIAAPPRSDGWLEERRGLFLDADPAARISLRPLTVFTFLWAAQALVHQHFYQAWLTKPLPLGWIVTALALAVLLRPGSLAIFGTWLVASVAFGVARWPAVANHILVETVANATILGAFVLALREQRNDQGMHDLDDPALAQSIWERIAPVLMAMTVLMFASAFVAKLNTDFLDASASCTSVLFGDLLRRFPFLQDTEWARATSIWGTVVIEAALPALLAFRRTRPVAVAIGLPFHLMLGLSGHRTYSALVYALYFLFLPHETCAVLGTWKDRAQRLLGESRILRLVSLGRMSAVLATVILVAFATAGMSEAGAGPFRLHRIPGVLWILASLAASVVYSAAIFRALRARGPVRPVPLVQPGLVWLGAVFVALSGASPYLGLKTELAFTAYSNLRTEGQWTNHLFLPSSFQLFGYQDDLVRILQTDDPTLQTHVERDELITWFELRRFTSEAGHDFHVTYERAGQEYSYTRVAGAGDDPELDLRHPLWARKLLAFRPVSAGECQECRH